ncbi:MAG: ABC transporter permease, partial [Actinomycetota bacterium]|nr:ABC transporter permease [Actinomycetota bacterium]
MTALLSSSGLGGQLKRVTDHRIFGPGLKLLIAYVVLIEVVVQVIFGQLSIGPLVVGIRDAPVPRAIFLNGATIGLLYALLGMGLILVYRANRIINFAQAQLGSVPAVTALLVMLRKDVNYFLTLPIVLLGGIALGALVERTIIRRFRDAPRLILTVATIGVQLLLLAAEFGVQTAIVGKQISSNNFTTPWSTLVGFDVGPLRFNGDFIMAAVVTAVICALLGAFFRFTDMGIAVRASAENGERAALLGIPVARVSTIVWIIAATLSAVAVFLRAPLTGLTLGSSVGASVLLYGLAAAVIARMESLPMCVIAGMGIGIIDQSALYGTRRASLAVATMLVVILVALLLQRGRLARAFDAAGGTWQAVKEYRPVPAVLRQYPEVVLAKGILANIVLFVAIVLPLILPERFAARFALVVIFAIVGVSLVILTGWSGQISLGQWAFSGIGAAVAGSMAVRGWDFFLCILVAGLVGALTAVLVGLPALRIQGLFLAVTTLAFAFTVQNFVLNRDYFGDILPKTGDIVARPKLYGVFSTRSDVRFYFVCLAFLVLFLLVARSIRKNRLGRILIGVRDNGKGVQAYGVNLARTRLAAFAISGFIAAVAGGLYAFLNEAVFNTAFRPERSITVFAITVIGGLTSLPGAVLGSIYVEGVPVFFGGNETIALLTSSVGLLVLLLVVPGGLSEVFYRSRDNFLRWVAKRHDVHVPSLVADSLVRAEEQPQDVIAGAEKAVEAAELLVGLEPLDLIGCPVCGANIPVVEAKDHDHFRLQTEAGV